MTYHRNETLMIDVVLEETERFVEKLKKAQRRFASNPYYYYNTKEFAAAKRASMDLSRMLTKLRKPRSEW